MAERAGEGFEFQCLHGMGEPLYEHVVGADNLDLPCRIYAPVGTHETLLAYLVRRLLENGANTSFVNQVADERIDLDELVADPVTAARARSRGCAASADSAAGIALSRDRRNSAGLDLADERPSPSLRAAPRARSGTRMRGAPLLAHERTRRRARAPLRIAADVDAASSGSVARRDAGRRRRRARGVAELPAPHGRRMPASERAAVLERAADSSKRARATLMHLAMREAGKTLVNAVGEVREAADFCRYYARQVRAPALDAGDAPLGTIVAHQPVELPAGDLRRPGRRPRSPPATRSSPSPPSRRR